MMKIREMRMKMELTQEELSKLTGIPKRTIENWEGEVRQASEWTEKLIIEKMNSIEKMIKMGIELRTEMFDADDARSLVIDDIIHDYLTDHETEYGYTVAYFDGDDYGVIYRNGKEFEILTGDTADEFCEANRIY